MEIDKYSVRLQILGMQETQDKQKYRQLCRTTSLPIFIQDWWWDALCGDSWDVLLVENSGQIEAVMPYQIQKKYGFRLMNKPPFTIYNEPYICACKNTKQTDLYSHQFRYLQAIFQLALAKKASIKLQFSPDITHTIGLHQLGFHVAHHYTHILAAEDEQLAWERLNRNVKRNILAAQQNTSTLLSDDYEIIYTILKGVFSKSKTPLNLSFEQFERLDMACKVNKARKIIVAKNASGSIIAFVYLVSDDKKIYLLISGGEAADLKSGVMQLLYWEVVKEAILQQKILDFDGSVLPNIEAIIRSFGGVRTPKTIVTHYSNPLLKAIDYLKS